MGELTDVSDGGGANPRVYIKIWQSELNGGMGGNRKIVGYAK